MKKEKVMTLGVFAHANAGKTTITENLLYDTNVIDKIGRVDNGDTVTDSMKVEKERGITVRSSLVSFDAEGTKVQLIDTPGHVDFSAEVERAINVLDGAVLAVSGVEGIEAQTYTIWNALKEKKVPTIFFINKMDRDGADYEAVLKELKEKLEVPVISLEKVEKKGKEVIVSKLSKDEIIEQLSSVESGVDDIIESYLEDPSSISDEKLNKRIEELSQKGIINIVIGGSALKSIGTKELVHYISKCLPESKRDLSKDFSAYVYTVRVNEEGQKNLYVKVLTGEIASRDIIKLDDENEAKVKSVFISDGKDTVNTSNLKSGDIGIITGVDAKCGQILGNQENKEKYLSFVTPLINMEVDTADKNQILQLVNALKVLNDEDPYLNVRYSKNTKKIYLSLMGEVQAEIIEEMLRDRFGIDAILSKPMIIHKEKPVKEGSGEAYYTRVSGLKLEVKPLPEGSGFQYKSKLSTDFLHKKYQRQTERLISQYSKQGLFGWEVTDTEVSLVDGRFDSMGSEPKHFNIAVPLAFMRALKDAGMKILEPISSYTIVVPKEHLSMVIQELSKKGSTFEIDEALEENVRITGEAPLDVMAKFPIELNKLTSGRGIYSQKVRKYKEAREQQKECPYVGADQRNEVPFVINDMGASLDFLDPVKSKKKKVSRAKFKRERREKQIREEKKKERSEGIDR